MFNEGFLPFPDVNDFDVIMIYQSVILSVSLCYYTLYSLSVFSLAESLLIILGISATYRFISVNSRLADARYYEQNPDPRQKLWGFDWKCLPLLRTLAITELRTLSWYQSDNFIVLTLGKADTLYFSYNIIM